jgi:hypothetical protein
MNTAPDAVLVTLGALAGARVTFTRPFPGHKNSGAAGEGSQATGNPANAGLAGPH